MARPKNTIPTITVSLQLPRAKKQRMARIARRRGMALATWLRSVALMELLREEEACD